MNQRIYSKGFTLIELLVVISIIGLLSSVVLASVRVARDKGEIAAGQKFSGYNFRTLNANAVVSYNFNDTTSTVTDLSGNGYNLVLSAAGCGSSPFCRSASSPTNSGTSLLLNGDITTYGATAAGNTISFSGMTGATISAWIYPTAVDATNGEPIVVTGPSLTPSFILGISPSSSLFAKIGTTAFTSSTLVTLNKWQHVSAVFNGSKIRLYVNGRIVGELAATDAMPTTASALGVGVGITTAALTYFNGNIDDVSMYKEALSASEVFKLYAQGEKEHNLASNN